MDLTLKSFSLLLSYPSPELQREIPELRRVLDGDRRLGRRLRRRIGRLLTMFEQEDVWDLQERYVDLFDRSRSLSLNLFEHVHGESRDRGSAMVDLLETYERAGFVNATPELPDHLPLLLEFLSTRPPQEAKALLADAAHLFEALAARLERRKSDYAPVFRALVVLAGASVSRSAVAALLERPDESPDDLAALDRAWEESEVTFGPDPGAGCPKARDLLAGMEGPQVPPLTTGPDARQAGGTRSEP
ncbi:MAG: nitrate reductase molybdenum cofactor assembly chaperone [Paracoccaceae bacterium]|nr:nitrate reductase molybdenum cofactor assembly chaperone [Paracoccaceae bacterium]